METLVVAAQHRNQRFGTTGSQDPFSSRGFNGINCRTFQSGTGILPSPNNIVANHLENKSPRFHSEPPKRSKRSSPIPIGTPKSLAKQFNGTNTDSGGLSCPELWAGPAYSNSPPPSSLPMPKFSLRPKRSVSLDIPTLFDEGIIELHQMAKSAPSSPSRGSISPPHDFFATTASATETLRRILRLDD